MRHYLILIVFLSLAVAGQDTVSIPDVPGIRLGENRLDFPGSRDRFDSLLSHLQEGDKHLNILHIGGSHVQAGIFPHRLTVVRGRDDVLPDEAGRHNTLAVIEMAMRSAREGKWLDIEY